jgi:glycosyltransferase involved in cell wall biosynthesis
MPNALLEAMACGLPCIATRVSGSEDIIADGLNGILVESEQPVQIADALRCIIEDAELAHRLGLEARVTVVREYQLAQSVERCLALYRQLLAENHHETGYSCI